MPYGCLSAMLSGMVGFFEMGDDLSVTRDASVIGTLLEGVPKRGVGKERGQERKGKGSGKERGSEKVGIVSS